MDKSAEVWLCRAAEDRDKEDEEEENRFARFLALHFTLSTLKGGGVWTRETAAKAKMTRKIEGSLLWILSLGEGAAL